MWDSVPWFVGGGAVHSPEVARLLAFAALGGAEGVVSTGDLKVVPLDVPGTQVRVSDGAALILNRSTGGDQQTYVARNPDYDVVSIAATGSDGPRSDLIVAQIEDPNMPGEPWQEPSDPTVGPYIFTRVIPNVPKTTKRLQDVPGYEGRSAITLARIDLPASTGTVTSALITDLRQLARPRSTRIFATGVMTDGQITLSTGSWQNFPANPIGGIAIPSWATHAAIRVDTTVRYVSGDAYCNFQGFLGPAGQLDATTLYTDMQLDGTTGGGQYRQPLIVPSNGLYPIPASLRGTTATITSRVRGKSNGGVIGTSSADYYFADITFLEQAV